MIVADGDDAARKPQSDECAGRVRRERPAKYGILLDAPRKRIKADPRRGAKEFLGPGGRNGVDAGGLDDSVVLRPSAIDARFKTEATGACNHHAINGTTAQAWRAF